MATPTVWTAIHASAVRSGSASAAWEAATTSVSAPNWQGRSQAIASRVEVCTASADRRRARRASGAAVPK